MSSAEPDRTLRPSLPAAAAAPAGDLPKAPNNTFASERPIASLISLVRRLPDAPTRVPATMRAKLLSVKPLAATARPGKAFRNEGTAGMLGPTRGRREATART